MNAAARSWRWSAWSGVPKRFPTTELSPHWVDNWDELFDHTAGEEAPIGLLLCAGADSEQVELMDLESAGIRVAEYLARIPDMKVLQRQLHKAVERARERAERGLLAPAQDNGGVKP